MAKSKKNKNYLIITWKKYFTKWCKKVEKKKLLKPHEVKDQIKKYAQEQLEDINRHRPNQDIPMEDQCNEYQLEYINWLKYVMQTGEL